MCLLTETRALSAQGEKRALVGNLTMPITVVLGNPPYKEKAKGRAGIVCYITVAGGCRLPRAPPYRRSSSRRRRPAPSLRVPSA